MTGIIAVILFVVGLHSLSRHEDHRKRKRIQLQAELDREQVECEARRNEAAYRLQMEQLEMVRDTNREWIQGQIRLREIDEPWKGGGS